MKISRNKTRHQIRKWHQSEKQTELICSKCLVSTKAFFIQGFCRKVFNGLHSQIAVSEHKLIYRRGKVLDAMRENVILQIYFEEYKSDLNNINQNMRGKNVTSH